MEAGFPEFRRSKDNKTYYKITSMTHFEEIKIIGSSAVIFQTNAKQLPEQNYIRDLITSPSPHFDPITEEEYNKIKKLYDL
ncbi:MAG: hypothetical protein ACK40G_13240 [Cytophagaceae bacterium]